MSQWVLIRVGQCAAEATSGGITKANKSRLEYPPMTSTQQNEKQRSESPHTTQAFIVGFWGVRYQVKDVQRAITFYTQTLGFNLDMQNLPAFGQVSIGGLKLILSGPGASGSRPMPMAVNKNPADGTVCFFRCRIWLRALLT